MTLIDPSYPTPSSALVAGYAVLCVFYLLCGARAAHLGSTRSHYYHIYTVRFLFPLLCVILALENATLASSRRFYDTAEDSPDGEISAAQQSFLYFVFACVSLAVPILLVATFELTYLVHKRRSVNFCGMFFDEGQRIRRMITTPIKSFVLRNFIRAIAVFLTVLNILVNFDLVDDTGSETGLDPRCGWVCLFKDGRPWDEKVHILLSLIPTGILILCNAYFSFLLWRYGTEFSIVVHASILNPWFSLSFGTGAMAATQIFGYPPYFPCTSNLGLLIFIVSILLLMVEVDKDMVAADEFADFLAQVARKGDKTSVTKKSPARPGVAAGVHADAEGGGDIKQEGKTVEDGVTTPLSEPAVDAANAVAGDNVDNSTGPPLEDLPANEEAPQRIDPSASDGDVEMGPIESGGDDNEKSKDAS